MERLSGITGLDEIYEDNGDELGGLMGWLLYGDVTPDDIEAFMASEEVSDHFPDGVRGGWDVEEVYVRKVPREYGWAYVYGAPGRGARRALKVEQYHFWERWCFNHPLEGATTGVPASQVSDAEPLPGEGYIYLCRECANRFSQRLAEARRSLVGGAA